MEHLNAAIIGCGAHAQSHFRMIQAEPRLRLAAIAEIDLQRRERAAAEHHPEQAFADYRQMLDACNLDMVYVTTQAGFLLPIVRECLERDLHVSIEKPPGMSSAETEEMAAIARSKKVKAMVSFNRRYYPEVLAVRRLVREHGGAVHCAATYNKPRVLHGTPAMAAFFPDPIICDAIHNVDLLRWLAGATDSEAARPVEVHAQVHDGERPGTHRHNALIRFESGCIATMQSHYGVGYRIQRAEVHAEDFSAYLDLTRSRRYELYRAVPADANTTKGTVVEAPLDLDDVGGKDFDETRHFVDCIVNDRTPWSPLDDAVQTMRLCEAIRQGHKGAL